MIAVISPHLDDAVLSLTEFLLTQDEPVTIITVFSEGNAARKSENAAALDYLGFTSRNLGLPDEPDRSDALAPLELAQTLNVKADRVLAPVGIRHPDHVLVSEAAILGVRIAGFYEELPYRVMYPDDRAARVAELRKQFTLTVDSCGGHLEQKRSAVAAYASQWGEDFDRCAFAPERVWWVQR